MTKGEKHKPQKALTMTKGTYRALRALGTHGPFGDVGWYTHARAQGSLDIGGPRTEVSLRSLPWASLIPVPSASGHTNNQRTTARGQRSLALGGLVEIAFLYGDPIGRYATGV